LMAQWLTRTSPRINFDCEPLTAEKYAIGLTA